MCPSKASVVVERVRERNILEKSKVRVSGARKGY